MLPADITCPVCEQEFEAIKGKNGACKCGNNYAWTEECADDYSECWDAVYWENYKDFNGAVIKYDSFKYVW